MRVLLIALLVLACLPGCLALKGSNSWTDDGNKVKFKPLKSFHYEKNGHLFLSTEVEFEDPPPANPSFSLWLFKRSDYWNVYDYSGPEEVCEAIPNIPHEFYVPFNGSFDRAELGPISEKGVYYLVYMNCEYVRVHVKVRWQFVNPGGQQLGWDNINRPYMYTAFAVAWAILLIAWVANWVYFRSQKSWLHRVITIYPFAALIWEIYAAVYWYRLSQTGSMSDGAIVVYWILYTLQLCMMFLILMLIARGWRVRDNENVSGGGRAVIVISLVTLAVAVICGGLLSGYFVLLTMLAYIIILVAVFSWSKRSAIICEGNPVKAKMFKTFRVIMIVYIIMLLVIVVISAFLLFDYPWIIELLYETLAICIFVAIMWTFRLRKHNIYYVLDEDNVGTGLAYPSPNEREMQDTAGGSHVDTSYPASPYTRGDIDDIDPPAPPRKY